MLFAWRFSRTFASRLDFANVVFFLPATVDLQVVQRTRTYWTRPRRVSTILRPADARPRLERLATSTPNALPAHRAEASLRRRGRLRVVYRQLRQRPLTARRT